MTKNLLVGLSTVERSGKYLYNGAYDTDNIQTLVAGEIGIFFAAKSAGPDADTGVYTGGSTNDDAISLSGSNIDIDDTPNIVTEIDTFFFAQGTANGSKAILGNVISPKGMSFKVQEYVAPVKKVQTVTIAAASIVAGKLISFSAYAAEAPVGAVGTLKSMDIEYLIPTGGTATTVGAALKVLVDAHPFSTKNVSLRNIQTGLPYLYSCSEAHSSDVVLTITWEPDQNGDIKNNSYATATSTIATSYAMVSGKGEGRFLLELEKECAAEKGYNRAPAASDMWSEPFYISATGTYGVITITHKTEIHDTLGTASTPTTQTQYIAIDTGDAGNNLLENIVSVLTDIVDKKTLAPTA
jgi:hypothetical protein